MSADTLFSIPLPAVGGSMAEKKSASRFCIQFNEQDAHHQQVVEILNGQGHHKAKFIATAIFHYIHCGETPNIAQDDTRLRQAVESIVQEVLERRDGISKKQPSLPASEVPLRKIRRSTGISTNMENLDGETLSAIRDSLSAFRSLET